MSSPESRPIVPERAYAPAETAWPTNLPPELYPPTIVVEPHSWCPTVGYADPVYAGLSDEDKAHPWRTAPLSARLTAAVRGGIARVASKGLLFSYGGEPRRFELMGVPHGRPLTVPYLWCLGPELFSFGQLNTPPVAALADIQRFAGNSDLYAYFPHNRWAGAVIDSIAREAQSALTGAHIPHTVVQNFRDSVVMRITDDWPLVFPFWRGRVRVDDGRGSAKQAAAVSYQPSLPTAACEIRIQRMHPPANPSQELVACEMVLVDTAGRPFVHAPKVLVNRFSTSEAAMRHDHRYGWVNWRQTHLASVFLGPYHLLTAYGDGVRFDAVPDALPDDPGLCYATLWRMVSEIMHRAYGLPDTEARTVIADLARQVKPGTDRLMEVMVRHGHIAPAKVQEGFMQIIRWTTTQPHGLALLVEALGMDRLFPRAHAVTAQLARAWEQGQTALPLADADYTASVQTPTIAVNGSRYFLRSPNAIKDVVSCDGDVASNRTSSLDRLAFLWDPISAPSSLLSRHY